MAYKVAWSIGVLLVWSVASGMCDDDLTIGPFIESSVVNLGDTPDNTQQLAAMWCTISLNDVESRWLYEGEPINDLSMFKDRVLARNGFHDNENVFGTQLLLFRLTYEDAGMYTCQAKRIDDPSSEWCSGIIELQLQVLLEPLQPTITIHNDSQSVSLECDMAGYLHPDDSLQWFRMGEIINGSSSRHQVKYSIGDRIAQNGGDDLTKSRVSALVIQDPEMEDSGVYTCQIKNTDVSAEINLSVLEVKAPSGYPQGVRASVVSSTEILISWDEVEVGERNGLITQYEVEYSQSEFTEIPAVQTVFVEAPNMEVNLAALKENLEYSVSIRAYTVVGEGPFSPAVTNTTLQDAPSGYPQNVTAESISSTEILVSWAPVPEIERNGDVILYEVQLIQLPLPSEAIIFPVNTSASGELTTLVGPLDEYVEYGISVRAFTEVGPGPFSLEVNERTLEAAPDSAPEGLVIVSFNASTLGATWERPPDQTINGMLRRYIIEYCKVDEMPESECKVANVSGDTTRVLLTDLEEQQAYNVSIAAYTIGPGPFASVVTTAEDIMFEVVTPEVELGPDNPTPATNLSFSIANNGNFVWQWKLAGATNSLPQVGDRYNFHQELADVQTSSLEIRNLRRKDADVYVCEVRYENWEDILVASGTASLQLNYDIEATSANLTALDGDPSVELMCDVYGYIPTTNLRWFRDNVEIKSGGSSVYLIEEKPGGRRMAQTGGVTPGPSILSVLTIKDPVTTDSGTYYCGTSKNDSVAIELTVLKSNEVGDVSPGDDDNIIVIVAAVVVAVVFAAAVLVALVVIGLVLRRKKKKKSGVVAANEEFTAGDRESQNGGPVAMTAEEDVSIGEPLPNSVPTGDSLTEPQLTDAEIAPEKPKIFHEITDSFALQLPQAQTPPEETTLSQPSDSELQLYEKPPMLLLTSPPPLSPLATSDEVLQLTPEHTTAPAAALEPDDLIDTPPLVEESVLQQDDDDSCTSPLHSSTPIPSPDTAIPQEEAGITSGQTSATHTHSHNGMVEHANEEEMSVSPPPYETVVSPAGTPQTAV